ncbi:MAG: hypothetical protein J3K34DRAFT_404944 [Monoraphidium minutum]|nr:MAG: hypothetical protein J3K34DRAFT_404944 [Monoraphidium minutum]
MPALEDRTIKCARYFQRSDGFIRFKDPDAMAARIAKLPDGGSMRLAAEDVEGYNIDTIRLLEAKAHESFNTTFNVEYYYYNMPRHLDDASDADAMSHVLARYGCLLESLQLKTERAAAVNFMTSNMPFGYTLVVPGPQPRSSGVAETGLNFLRPFTWQVWVAIIGLWLVTSAAIMFFENKEEYGEFGDRASRRRKGDAQSFAAPSKPKGHKSGLGSHTWANKFAYSSFSSWLTFTTGHFVTPVSAAGRLFTMVVTFVCLGLVAAYTANLATIFTTAALPVQGIGNINDLVARGARLCVKDSKTHTGFFKAVHPEVKLEAIKGEEPEVLDALMRGRCMAGASSNTHMSYFLATNASWWARAAGGGACVFMCVYVCVCVCVGGCERLCWRGLHMPQGLPSNSRCVLCSDRLGARQGVRELGRGAARPTHCPARASTASKLPPHIAVGARSSLWGSRSTLGTTRSRSTSLTASRRPWRRSTCC